MLLTQRLWVARTLIFASDGKSLMVVGLVACISSIVAIAGVVFGEKTLFDCMHEQKNCVVRI